MVKKFPFFDTYLPPLLNVVCERPLSHRNNFAELEIVPTISGTKYLLKYQISVSYNSKRPWKRHRQRKKIRRQIWNFIVLNNVFCLLMHIRDKLFWGLWVWLGKTSTITICMQNLKTNKSFIWLRVNS